jgi:hypothetical protein
MWLTTDQTPTPLLVYIDTDRIEFSALGSFDTKSIISFELNIKKSFKQTMDLDRFVVVPGC